MVKEMLNLHSLFKSNNETKQGKAFNKVMAAIQTVVSVIFAFYIIAAVLKEIF